eukprot:3764456-Alexandrium_andersonii.AAC.1
MWRQPQHIHPCCAGPCSAALTLDAVCKAKPAQLGDVPAPAVSTGARGPLGLGAVRLCRWLG